MKYKVGDKVKIRKDLEMGKAYGVLKFTPKMCDFRGKIARITEVNSDGEYRIDLSPHCFYWTDEMLEDVDMEVQKVHRGVTITVVENKVIAYSDGKRGEAHCHPDDKFDFYVGAKLALERLEEAEKPYGWLKKGVRYYFPVPSISDLYNSVTYTADDWDKIIVERGLVFRTKEEAIACAKKMLAAVKQEG